MKKAFLIAIFLVGGSVTASAELSKRLYEGLLSAEAQVVIKGMATMYQELSKARYDSRFHRCGYAACSPLSSVFMKTYNKLKYDKKYEVPGREVMFKVSGSAFVGTIWMLGREYYGSKGQDTKYSRWAEKKLRKFFALATPAISGEKLIAEGGDRDEMNVKRIFKTKKGYVFREHDVDGVLTAEYEVKKDGDKYYNPADDKHTYIKITEDNFDTYDGDIVVDHMERGK